MTRYESFVFPNITPEIIEYFSYNDKRMVIVGIIGKSSSLVSNNILGQRVYNRYPSDEERNEGFIKIFFNKEDPIIFVHFGTTFDNHFMEKALEISTEESDLHQFLVVNSFFRRHFARSLLFATQICHVVVLMENYPNFDTSYLPLLKSLKTLRERHILRFLPKFIKNSSVGTFLGKDGRLCSPRFLFVFQNCFEVFDNNGKPACKCEFELEDNIYKMLRNEFIITNNSSLSLFSIPSNKRFVFMNKDGTLEFDSFIKSLEILDVFADKLSIKKESLSPFKSYETLMRFQNEKSDDSEEMFTKRKFSNLLKEHITEAIQSGFDDNMSKFKGKSHFYIPKIRAWFDAFKLLHKIFLENPVNPNFEADDADYKAYLDNFNGILDSDEEFFLKCCDAGVKQAMMLYSNPIISHYSSEYHRNLVDDAISLYMKYARGTNRFTCEKKIREKCETIWKAGKQQCEHLSLRGNPCIKPKHASTDPASHSSGAFFISTCNCGRTQGRREDPYTVRQANYDFYDMLINSCTSCNKLVKVQFPIFEPSINDFRAADIEAKSTKSLINHSEYFEHVETYHLTPRTILPTMSTNLSLGPVSKFNTVNYGSTDDSLTELVIKIHENSEENESCRQPSTTEYLPHMIHTESPAGLLPQFSSWSLMCIGPSSIYSHNTGLLEHFQSGFLSGANFLLPWDVHVRLEQTDLWTLANSKPRDSKKGQVFTLKIFVGCEYECPRGHRFMMCSADKVLRGGVGIIRDSGSKLVYNDMPLYFPCPCRTSHCLVAQLMRIHIVTPKAPVNILLDPKVRTGNRKYIFTMGLPYPAKLSQSAYWILRLPYVYQGDDGPLLPPTQVCSSAAVAHGCLLSGMYGVSESYMTL